MAHPSNPRITTQFSPPAQPGSVPWIVSAVQSKHQQSERPVPAKFAWLSPYLLEPATSVFRLNQGVGTPTCDADRASRLAK